MIEATMVEATAADGSVDQAAAVALLQAVADPVRWEILRTLATRPACVCRLAEHVPIAANLLSYHLKVLREVGLVTSAKRGRWVDYALAEEAAARMRAALPDALVAPARCASGDLVAAAAVSP
ncbi:metalloregulator ArsR/SmtB family transcription factor [Actinotalea sp.]|uniref:ArsR/SmtB family transcription factor n=1 Tax=Actinotalea sp. TaxID=1872145 RepID=UPI002BE24DE0|nr:metalloregulator ArsR/SmtB family transcription factor [Actinotalea sp.]HRA51077.1 metalloregulator ArsR/SmtB family transcription factor [Actinotalea sp.]